MEKLKSPAFQFYSSDFMTGTTFMSNEEVGAYIRCLCMQHQKGHLKEKEMQQICLNQEVLDSVMNHYKQDDEGLFYNERLDFEKEKSRKYSESRAKNRAKKDNISKTYDNTYEKDMKNICNSYDKHMEDEEEDINKEYIINYYINNINTNISSIEYSKLEEYINIFSNDLRIIVYGIEYCKMYKAYSINYLCKILNSWNKAKYKTLEEIKLNERKVEKEKEERKPVEVYDTDWLND